MAMEDHFDVIEMENLSSHGTSGFVSTITSHNFPVVLKNVVCSLALLAILLILCLRTSPISILINTAILIQCLAYLLIVSCTFVFSSLIVTVLIFYVERYSVMKKSKALFYVFALKTSAECFFCSSSVLLSWYLVIKPDMTIFVIHFVTSALATFVIATGMCMLKIVILKVLDCRFRDKDFFQHIQDKIYHEYVLQRLLGPSRLSSNSSNSTLRVQPQWIKEAFANMLLLMGRRLHTICDALESSNSDEDQQVEKYISMVFKNLTNNELRDIQETDLLCVMKKEDMDNVLQSFEGAAETKSISEASLRKWMVEVCNQRKLVGHLLNYSNNASEQLNRIAVVNVLFLAALVWCFFMGFAITKFLVHISSLILPLVFLFGDYCKTICQGITFAIVMHPFNIGDHCIIDDNQLIVQEIGLINTVFIKDNNENVNFPNSLLLTKSISNLNRSSELRETLELLVGSTTSTRTIAALKLKINELLRSKAESWRPDHCLDLKGIDDMTSVYNLQITHTRNFENYKEKKYQRDLSLFLDSENFWKTLKLKNLPFAKFINNGASTTIIVLLVRYI